MSSSDIMQANADYWRKCNSCKKPISYRATYWTCNVSTCNRKRTGLFFCSVSCWDAHLPIVNHRESWAEEHQAPSIEKWKEMLIEEQQPKKRARNTGTNDFSDRSSSEEARAPTSSNKPAVILRRKS
jgi:hypothetical protein